MEGPSLVLLKEELKPFLRKKVERSTGVARIDHSRLQGSKLKRLLTWGKHFLLVFDNVVIRIHFLMFGSYRINERRDSPPRLSILFEGGDELNVYAAAVKELEGDPDEIYDWSTDVMNDEWNPSKARRKLKAAASRNVGDVLLDQEIFSGVGNIIKNEVLFRIRVHPESVVGALPPRKLGQLIQEARIYSFDFYEWKKAFSLKKHWLIHTRKRCPRCDLPSILRYTGKTKRRSFFCENCQVLYEL